ncbi:MAG: hypothetical protein WD601_04030, partial [Pseudohongiellaceae bacterium]
LVDLSVAAVAGLASAPQALYVDMQLHQSVLVRLHNQDGHLERETVQQIPGAGLMALHDAWSSMITEAFIKQSRFNPLHNAETEQYIYNRLEEWINAARDDNEVLLEINHKGTVHQAKVNQGYFEQKARNIFGRIRQEIDTLGFAGGEIFMPAETAVLPGVQVYLPALQVVDTEHLARYCLAASEHITGDPESLGFVTRLPAANQAVTSGRAVNPALPSHILVNHRAYRLPDQMLYIGSRPDRLPSGKGISFIEVDDPSLSGPITLSRTSEGFRLEPNSNDSIRINGESPETVNALSLGDRINLVNSGINIQLNQVE